MERIMGKTKCSGLTVFRQQFVALINNYCATVYHWSSLPVTHIVVITIVTEVQGNTARANTAALWAPALIFLNSMNHITKQNTNQLYSVEEFCKERPYKRCNIYIYILLKPYIKETKCCIAVITLRNIRSAVITPRNIKSADQSYTEFLMSIHLKGHQSWWFLLYFQAI